MKGNSNTQPDRLERIGQGYQVRWNIVRNDRKNEDNQPIESWDYEYVNVSEANRDAIIRAVIRDRYQLIDDEIAVINNKDSEPDEYAAYQNHRSLAKALADEALQ